MLSRTTEQIVTRNVGEGAKGLLITLVYYISQVPEAKGVLQVPYYIRILMGDDLRIFVI